MRCEARAVNVRRVFSRATLWGAALAVAVARAVAAQPADGQPAERVSALADQQRINVTIYNGSVSLVHDVRRIALAQGENRIAWRDVSANLDATTAILSDLGRSGGVNVVEQNFDFDLLKPSTVLDKYVGRKVTVVHPHPIAGQPARETATLLSDNEGVVLAYADRVETGLQDGYIVYPSLPGNLRDRPTLVLDVQAAHAETHVLDLAYLTNGLAWHADYVGVVSADEKQLDLNGLVTLSNTTGATYRNAHLQLVAGNVHEAAPQYVMPPSGTEEALPVPAPQFSQENYFEYHLYTLQRTTTIASNQTKQVSLLSAHHVPIRKTLELRGQPSYYTSASGDLGAKLAVGVYVTFANKNGELGIPLPMGTMRLYKNDTRGTSQYLGSDAIDHTPRNEDVRLHLGDSFDVTANRKQTTFRVVTRCVDESSYDVTLKNAKADAADVLVVEPIPGDWTISAETIPHRKTSASTASWDVRVPADGQTTLRYTARVKSCS